MKTILIGLGIGAAAGVVALISFEILSVVWLDTQPTTLGVVIFAVPIVCIPSIGGGLAALLFQRVGPSRLVAAVCLVALYLGLWWLFGVSAAAIVRRMATPQNSSGLMALPVMVVVAWALGVPLMIPTAVVIRRAVRFSTPAA